MNFFIVWFKKEAWLGLKDLKWSDSSPPRFENWMESGGVTSITGCAYFDTSLAKWGLAQCDLRKEFVCKAKPISKPNYISVCHD